MAGAVRHDKERGRTSDPPACSRGAYTRDGQTLAPRQCVHVEPMGHGSLHAQNVDRPAQRRHESILQSHELSHRVHISDNKTAPILLLQSTFRQHKISQRQRWSVIASEGTLVLRQFMVFLKVDLYVNFVNLFTSWGCWVMYINFLITIMCLCLHS